MSEKIWLDGYSGQSVDELLALEPTHRVESLLFAFEQALVAKAELLGDANLSTEELTVLAVVTLQREVNHGGYDYLFSYEAAHVPVLVTSLRRIGCPRVAEITQAAIDALELPKLTPSAVEERIFGDDESLSAKLNECDSRFYEYPEDVDDRLIAFILANRERISF